MKQLFATTAVLALTAGVAAAEVTLSGDARMGILNGFDLDPTGPDETGFTSRARVKFTLSGETDTGLSFGASFRADNAGGAASGTAGSVFVSGAFGKLSMGDVDGAANAAVGHVDGVGLTGLSDLNESTFIANGGIMAPSWVPFAANVQTTGDPSALVEYSANGLSVYASVTQPTYVFDAVDDDPDVIVDLWDGLATSVGASYTTGNYKFSAGYERIKVDDQSLAYSATMDQWILGADATFGDVVVKARYGQGEIEIGSPYADFDQYALSGTYSMDAVAVTAYLSNKTWTYASGANLQTVDAIGLGASYDLGGGASVVGGIARQKVTNFAGPSVSDTAFDLGLSFSF